ncbi:hypothetical protein ACFVFF_36945 [Streptomyces sp. NPDC057680]|uniref:hypothetical protein n=1 Tax=Streptomyces sp. NPDC057680 TaxID=3346208 RepID=UPI0036D10A8E
MRQPFCHQRGRVLSRPQPRAAGFAANFQPSAHLADGQAVEILADAGYQGLGAQTGGRVVTPPHRKFKKNPPD